MSKSLSFCKTVAQDASRSNYADRLWDKVIEVVDTEKIFDEFLRGVRNFHIKRGLYGETENCFEVNVSFDADADFDYFTSNSVVHDGTLYFVREAMDRCVRKVCFAQTYNKNIGEPKHGDNIRYIVGNFVILTEHNSDFAPTDKPWMKERTTVLLPLKMMKG